MLTKPKTFVNRQFKKKIFDIIFIKKNIKKY